MKIFKNYIFNSSYQLLLLILPFVTIPYISRVLGAHGVGLNTVTAAAVGYFVIFATLGTSQYGSREIAFHQGDKNKRSQAFWEITFLSWITSGITLFAFLIFLIVVRSDQVLYLWQGLAILTTMFDISWYFVGVEKFKITVTRNFIIRIISVICIFIFVRQPKDLVLYIIIMIGGGFLGSLSLWPYLRSEVALPDMRSLNLKKHLRGTLSLFLPAITLSIYTLLGKNLVGIFDSINHAGFYAQANSFITMSLSLIVSFSTVMQPRLANMRATGDTEGIRQATVRDININLGLAAGIFFGLNGIALKFAPYFWGQSFSMVGSLMMVGSPLVLLVALNYIFMSHYFLPLNRMRSYTITIVIGVALNVVLNFTLIPLFGVVGGMLAAVLTELTFAILQFRYMQKEFQLKKIHAGLWKYFVSGLVMFIIVFWMNQTFQMNLLQLALQVLVGIVIYVGMNIILCTQLWEIAKPLFVKIFNKNRVSARVVVKESSNNQKELLRLIPQAMESFRSSFSSSLSGRFSSKDFVSGLDELEQSLQTFVNYPDFVKSHAFLISQQLLNLSDLIDEESEKLEKVERTMLLKFSEALVDLSNKIAELGGSEYSLEQVVELLKAEL